MTSLFGIPLAVGMFVPHLCVDEAFSMITGREVVGFPKVGGEFEMRDEIWEVDGCVVSTLATEPYSANSPIELKPLLETRLATFAPLAPFSSALRATRVDPDDNGSLPDEEARPLWPFGPIDELYGRGSQFAVDERVLHLLTQSAGISLTNYSFKQFRDAELPNKACYQALVEGTTNIHQFGAGGMLPHTDITIHEYASIKIIEQLGLETHGTAIKPLFGIWYNADFTLNNVQNLTTRCGGHVGSPRPPHNCLQLWASSARSVLGFYQSMAEAWIEAIDDIDPYGGRRDR
ncbi:MAG: acetoacetate decarboxylase family protein [Gammaproteobacteria bacterium]|nr:acetoacetate decarboxylase family protein [Gammaproteobacteria bacterium]